METEKQRHWLRGLRPLLWWLVFVLILYAYHAHERLSEQTFLRFSPSLEGRSVDFEATAALDRQPFTSGARVPIGRHQLVISHEKAEPYLTNLFIWYGEHDLGHIPLKRGQGSLVIKANPPAGLIDIHGPEFSVRLTNSTGITATVPTDRYTVDVAYQHWQQRQETTVYSMMPGTCMFAPRLGSAQLTCNQSGASFQVLNAREQLLEAGELPATIQEVPEGNYRLTAWHHGNRVDQTLAVKAGTTISSEVGFRYGTAVLESDPPGATVIGADGRELGITPLRILDIPAGQRQYQLRLEGHEALSVTLDVAAQATNTFRTNLVNISYARAMNAARQFLAAADYDRALGAATDALQVKPNDPDAVAARNEALGKQHLRRAEALGKQGDYIGADKELELALQSLPENEEAKDLLAEFKKHEPEQIERVRQERLNRGKELFDSILLEHGDAGLFDSHELKTTKPVKEVMTGILNALKTQPAFNVTKANSPADDTFEIEAVQELTTGLATSAGRRRCLIVGARTRDDETQILFKVLEYKSEAVNKFSIGALIHAPVSVNYVPIHPSRVGKLSEKLQAQLREGVQILTDRIQKAIEQVSTQKQ